MRLIAVLVLMTVPAFCQSGQAPPDVDAEIKELRALVQKLLTRIDALETRVAPPVARVSAPVDDRQPVPPAAAKTEAVAQTPPGNPVDVLHGTTVNFLLDGYYAYNANSPVGRVNLLRAYDVSSNAFSLNQAALVLENAPDPARGKRFGARLDLQYGQATATLQGNANNEPRPEIYRAIFQAYGTYVFPLKDGLTVDFGKWSSSLGLEGNYTKDQMNYSRSYWFDFLPFYHMGIRTNFKVNDRLSLNHWIVNGANQTEPSNGFKDELLGFTLTPRKNVNWTVNYYLGQEHPDVTFYQNGGPSNLPTQQGLPFQPIRPAPNGKLHILDSYATWQATPKLSVASEFDYVVQRLWTYSPPSVTFGGAGYLRYQATPKFALAARGEYMTDRGGAFSGLSQALKETTFTTDYRIGDGFLLRGEWRRDFSNRPFFLTDVLGLLKKEQNTVTAGLVWWFGAKDGGW